MVSRDEARQLGESRDWSGAERDDTPASTVKITLGGKFPPDLAVRVMDEAKTRSAAEGRKVTVSEALADLAAEAFAARDAAGDEPVTIRPSDLLRAARQIGQPERPAA